MEMELKEKETIQSIRSRLEHWDTAALLAVVKEYEGDSRVGVQKLVAQYLRKYEKYQEELSRLEIISMFEDHYHALGYQLIAGVDEVGRGPLAGPVVAGAVILPPGFRFAGINDSKKLSPAKREALDLIIREKAVAVGIGVVDEKTIDKINILNATKAAMAMAIENLSPAPEFLLVDAVRLQSVPLPQKDIIKGDEKSISIGAASIIAKVYRDSLMIAYGKEFPQYGFESNKGYGAQAHIEALKRYGPCPIHRGSFLTSILGDSNE